MISRYSGYYPPRKTPDLCPPAKPPPRPAPPKPPVRPDCPLDAGDLILLALLWYLYKESRDEEFLIILIILAAKIFNIGSYLSSFSSMPFSSLLG